jgi:hypothetical protein
VPLSLFQFQQCASRGAAYQQPTDPSILGSNQNATGFHALRSFIRSEIIYQLPSRLKKIENISQLEEGDWNYLHHLMGKNFDFF